MKRILAISMACVLMVAVFAIAVSANFDTDPIDGTVYEVIQPKEISFSWNGVDDAHEVKSIPQGGADLTALIDGELVRDASGFSAKGIVLFQNTWIPANGVQGTSPADQPDDEIPTWSLSLDLGSKTKFDTAYLVLYHEIASCIAIPGNKAVQVETSSDGKTWVPVGGGTFYFNSSVGDYDGAGDQGVDECAVPLGETVESQYVRLTFTFMKVPEGGYWTNYTNVYEWAGLTEVGVAKYKSGREQSMIDPSEVEKDPTAVKGTWMCDNGDEILVYEFVDNHGDKTLTVSTFEAEAFAADPLSEPASKETFKYSVLGTKVTLTAEDGSVDEMTAEINDSGSLLINLAGDDYIFDPYTWPQPVESSEEETEEPTSEEETEEPTSEAESKAESKEESKEESKAESKEESKTEEPEEGGFPWWAWVIIGVVVVAIVVVVIVVVKKKKK